MTGTDQGFCCFRGGPNKKGFRKLSQQTSQLPFRIRDFNQITRSLGAVLKELKKFRIRAMDFLLGFSFFRENCSNPELGATRMINIAESGISSSDSDLGTIRKCLGSDSEFGKYVFFRDFSDNFQVGTQDSEFCRNPYFLLKQMEHIKMLILALWGNYKSM